MTVILRVLLEALVMISFRIRRGFPVWLPVFSLDLIATVWACVSQRCGPALGYRCSVWFWMASQAASWKERMLFWIGHTGWMWLWCLGSDVLFFFSRKYDEPCGLWKAAQSNTLVFPQLSCLNLLTLFPSEHPTSVKNKTGLMVLSLCLLERFLQLWDSCLPCLHFHILNATVSTVFPLAQRSNVLLHLAKGWAKGILLNVAKELPSLELSWRTAARAICSLCSGDQWRLVVYFDFGKRIDKWCTWSKLTLWSTGVTITIESNAILQLKERIRSYGYICIRVQISSQHSFMVPSHVMIPHTAISVLRSLLWLKV